LDSSRNSSSSVYSLSIIPAICQRPAPTHVAKIARVTLATLGRFMSAIARIGNPSATRHSPFTKARRKVSDRESAARSAALSRTGDNGGNGDGLDPLFPQLPPVEFGGDPTVFSADRIGFR